MKPGTEVVCPKCGKRGVAAHDIFSAKGKKYAYLVVRHREDGRLRRCLIQRLAEGAKPVAKPRDRASVKPRPQQRAKPAAKQARQARLPVEAAAPTPAPVAPAPAFTKEELERVIAAAVSAAVSSLREEFSRAIAEAVAAAIRDALSSVTAKLEEQKRELEIIKEQVRQRKGVGAAAVKRGEVRVRLSPGGLHAQIVEVLRGGRELTKEEIAAELERRFGRKVSGNSLSGRLSELKGAGLVECVRRGRTWYWRLAAAEPAARVEPRSREERKQQIQQSQTRTAVRAATPSPTATAAAASAAPAAPAATTATTADYNGGSLPSFAKDNPWLAILSGAATAASASTAAVRADDSDLSDLPSFAKDNPWLAVLSARV